MELPLTPARMISFSDGVIAVIITIMVLELRVPAHDVSNAEGIRRLVPILAIYALSFLEVGIYWVNHHYMVDDLEHVSHGLLWSNLSFLFTLSLIPFATAWVGQRGISPFALSLYSICSALPAVTWFILSTLVVRHTRKAYTGSLTKQVASSALYLGAIPVSYHSETCAILMIAAIAPLWLVPPKSRRQPDRVRKM